MFQELQGSDGPKRFLIEKTGEHRNLPRAHTCFNRLDLPEYRSYEELRSKIITTVEDSEESEGTKLINRILALSTQLLGYNSNDMSGHV